LKSLQELEQHDWGEPNFDSHLVKVCDGLRRKPLAEFTVEDLRIMIGQKVGVPFLVPLALEQLEIDPLVAGDYYRGDLLATVVRIDSAFWTSHPELLERMRSVMRRVEEAVGELDDAEQETVEQVMQSMSVCFRAGR
jgi:hypothetical protein